MEKKKKDQTKRTLTSMQEFLYSKDFKKADRAGGFTKK
ncbi:YfhE family protein [Bacillus sp. 1P06AnD]